MGREAVAWVDFDFDVDLDIDFDVDLDIDVDLNLDIDLSNDRLLVPMVIWMSCWQLVIGCLLLDSPLTPDNYRDSLPHHLTLRHQFTCGVS